MYELQQTLEKAIELSKATSKNMPWENKEFYANFIAQTFYYVKHSTRLLALSASRLNYDQQMIHVRFLKHLNEEANHEQLALNDLKALGYDLSNFKELNSTRYFYEPQYYKIEHLNPLAIMGYILYLEVLAQHICPNLTELVSKTHGKKTASFFLVHGEEDPHHVEQAQKLLSMLDPASLKLITETLEQSAYAFTNMANEIRNCSLENKSNKKVA